MAEKPLPALLQRVEAEITRADEAIAGGDYGTALTAMGKRSTLLRLHCTFATKNGRTEMATREVVDTNIIDVVTGGGQDCAVAD